MKWKVKCIGLLLAAMASQATGQVSVQLSAPSPFHESLSPRSSSTHSLTHSPMSLPTDGEFVYRVVGVVTTDEKRVAALIDQNGATHVVIEGDALDGGYFVKQINLRQVVIVSGKTSRTLEVPR